jgi:hypothetical protein
LLAYATEIIARTEQYFCPIKHARKMMGRHARYASFAAYGDAEDYQTKLEKFRADLAQEMNITSSSVAPGVDEMKLAGLAATASTLVKPPRVTNAIAALECKLISTTQLTDAKGNLINTWLTLGEVVGVHINNAFLKDGIFDTAAAKPLGRCGYQGDYVEVNTLFEMFRPKDYVAK